jgi:hypothetical protein
LSPVCIARSILANPDTVLDQADEYPATGVTTFIIRLTAEGVGRDKVNSLVAWRDQRNG